jgi:hypothetical protein
MVWRSGAKACDRAAAPASSHARRRWRHVVRDVSLLLHGRHAGAASLRGCLRVTVTSNAERQAVRAASQLAAFRARCGASRVGAESAKRSGLVTESTTHMREPLALERDQLRFSRLRKNIGIAAKLHGQSAPPGTRSVMVTLTYADGDGWRPDHVRNYLTHVRNWLKRLSGRALAYLWVAEVQTERQARDGGQCMHYHVLFWLPRGITMPKADKRGWWPHGMSKTERVRKNAVAYVMKYASKFESKEGVPHGARIYGVGGLDAADRGIRRWANWPSFVQARASVSDSFGPEVGGGWCNRATGEWWPAEWGLVLATKKHTVITRLHDHGRPVANVVGPYSWAPGYSAETVH